MSDSAPASPAAARDFFYTVQPNEDVQIIAADHGIADWKAVWEHPQNADLRSKRPDPHVLYKGDQVWIPALPPKEFEVATNQEHRFVLYEPKTLLHLVLNDSEGNPEPGVRYEIWINDERYDPPGHEDELRTREDGLIHHMVPVTRSIELRIFDHTRDEDEEHEEEQEEKAGRPRYDTITVMPGHLDPIDTVEGVQDRLNNLGYGFGDDEPGTEGPGTEAALREFQADYGLVPTGVMDDYTRARLLEAHGS